MSKTIIEVRQSLCLGCGLCSQVCPTGAISLSHDRVQINHSRCSHCRLCIDTCPQGAIVELAPVSDADLAHAINSLKRRTDDLARRIERLRSIVT